MIISASRAESEGAGRGRAATLTGAHDGDGSGPQGGLGAKYVQIGGQAARGEVAGRINQWLSSARIMNPELSLWRGGTSGRSGRAAETGWLVGVCWCLRQGSTPPQRTRAPEAASGAALQELSLGLNSICFNHELASSPKTQKVTDNQVIRPLYPPTLVFLCLSFFLLGFLFFLHWSHLSFALLGIRDHSFLFSGRYTVLSWTTMEGFGIPRMSWLSPESSM